MKTGNTGHRQRLREKYNRFGYDTFLDYEKLELLLTYAVPRIDVKPLAKELLCRFGGLSGVLDADKDELMRVPGVGENVATLIILIRQLGADFLKEGLAAKNIFEKSIDVIHYAKMKLAGLKKEVFFAIYLNVRNAVIDSEILSYGTVDQVFIHTRELLASVLKRNAKGLVLVHNHPGGSAEASPADLVLTEKIRYACDAMDIFLLDHLIITHDAAFSIGQNVRIDFSNEKAFVFPEEERAVAEQKRSYNNVPFRMKKLKRPISELVAGKAKEQNGEDSV